MSMMLRRAALSLGGSKYREVDWLGSSGTQYIDTGLVLGANDFRLEVTFMKTATTTQEQAIASIWVSGPSYWNLFIRNASNNNTIDVYTGAHHNGKSVAENVKYDAVLTRSSSAWSCTFDDDTFSWTYTPGSTNNTTLKLFTRGDAPATSSSNTFIRMYSCKIYIGGELKGDYVPRVRRSDNKPGLLDQVTGTFFTNARTTGDDFSVPS